MSKHMIRSILFLLVLIPQICSAVTVTNPRKDLYVSPGSSSQTSIKVINESKTEERMKVYQSDYLHQADGSNNFADPGTLERSNAKWIKFSPDYFTIKPGQVIEINIQVTVPKEKLEGSYWSMLMVEYVDKEEPVHIGEAELLTSTKIIKRQAVHIRTHITGTGVMKAVFLNKKVEKKNGKTTFELDLKNTGNVFYRGDFWVELFNKEGYPIGKIQLLPRGVYPDCSTRFVADVSQIKKGSYTALCVFDTRSQKVFGGKYQIDIP